ncbi:MAG TPA: B12-binding domain-containing radical SAM protein [Acholeplasmatales bacterium]|nr:MAG: hypothetical protein A2Y16_01030 [Tenericutes bacterium GWF2_57_13]HAQ56434.1 B12-binding domain-containing radical SAM protein [Acholeplasmatales bacterium]
MNIVLCAIDAKFIHTNVALRLLKANCPLPCELFEFTIKSDEDTIVSTILAAAPDLVAFSVYIWNVEIVRRVADAIRKRSSAKIVAGGPEVAHDAGRFLADCPFDFVVRGEGERAFARLVTALADGSSFRDIPNLAYWDGSTERINPIEPIADLAGIASPYRFTADEKDIPRKIQYLELSRGCPFSCAYCLAPLDGAVRFFPLPRIKDEILALQERGARTFKFLDRTFNVRPEVATDLFDFIIRNRRDGVVFQFEITGDILPDAIIRHLNDVAPPGLFRFEIGIQSTNDATNRAVARTQDNARLFKNIRALVAGGRVTIHLDLIAGLPEEGLDSFIRTFDDSFALFAPELQLGFLKMLRGTPLRRDAARLGYEYDPNPPYQVTKSAVLSAVDLDRIACVEAVLEHFWNRGFMPEAMKMMHACVPSMFFWMESLYAFLLDRGFSFLRHQIFEMFALIDAFAQKTIPAGYANVHDALVRDYLERAEARPKPWWTVREERREQKSALLQRAHAIDPSIPLDDYFKYGVVAPYAGGYLAAVYRPSGKSMIRFD